MCPRCRAPAVRKNDKTICYHGTDISTADIILKSGFKPGCWFSRHMEDALSFGGNVVLAVEFFVNQIPRGWQFHVRDSIPQNSIVGIYEIAAKRCSQEVMELRI